MSHLFEATVPDIGAYSHVDVIELFITVGQSINVDDALIALETDKAAMEVPATVAGIVRDVVVHVGSKVSAGDVIARIETVNEISKPDAVLQHDQVAEVPRQSQPSVSTPKAAAEVVSSSLLDPTAMGKAEVHAGPSARRLARELGVDLTQVVGSGRKGRITSDDITNYVKTMMSQPAPTGSPGVELGLLPWPKVDFAKFGAVDSQPLARIQKISGANLTRNWVMIPHVTQFDEADITEMEVFRRSLSEELKAEGVKLTALAFLVKACAAALKQYPRFNTSLDGDNLVLKRYFHIGFAADTPNGLVVPVVRDADKKSLLQLAHDLATLATKAREGKLLPSDMQGGCFSVSSLGGIGGTAFTPIINAPEVAILGVSKALIKPVWNGKKFKPRLMLPLSLSYDHRVIDGAAAARFTGYLAQLLGDIRRLML